MNVCKEARQEVVLLVWHLRLIAPMSSIPTTPSRTPKIWISRCLHNRYGEVNRDFKIEVFQCTPRGRLGGWAHGWLKQAMVLMGLWCHDADGRNGVLGGTGGRVDVESGGGGQRGARGRGAQPGRWGGPRWLSARGRAGSSVAKPGPRARIQAFVLTPLYRASEDGLHWTPLGSVMLGVAHPPRR